MFGGFILNTYLCPAASHKFNLNQIIMANTGTWHYLENQFGNATENSYKRANILGEDHLAKLAAEKAEIGRPSCRERV